MQQIITKEEIEKKEKRNKLILGIILVVLMIFSTAGYALYQSNKSDVKQVNYNGKSFILGEDGYWHFSIQNNDFSTQYTPIDTKNYSIQISKNINSYQGKNLYFSYDSDREAANEIARNIGRYADRIQFVCTEECSEDLPVKNCSENIIIIKNVNETLIKQEDNCIYILANTENSIKASDKFVFSILGV